MAERTVLTEAQDWALSLVADDKVYGGWDKKGMRWFHRTHWAALNPTPYRRLVSLGLIEVGDVRDKVTVVALTPLGQSVFHSREIRRK